MRFSLPIIIALFAGMSQSQTTPADPHLRGSASSAILVRSAFAHGYRHGYEEGYHLGNVDINMGRLARVKFSQFREADPRYSPACGPKKSFDAGFKQGLKAGYGDGFAGRVFRAVANLRQVSDDLKSEAAAADPSNVYFDQGVSSGYDSGLDRSQKDLAPTANVDLHVVPCSGFHPARNQDMGAEASFCEGYRRGYALGHADGFTLRLENAALQARK